MAGENSLTNPTSNPKYTKNIHFIADSGASEHIISNKGLILEEITKTNIHFIADSCASEHIISNKSLILEEITKTPKQIIKSANKN